jgi:2'-hydroxyisoflavone reductase
MSNRLRILVLGGTIFVGRHFVEAALSHGHDVTVFHRGNHPLAQSGVTEIIGDRNTDLSSVASKSWDAVVDTCGYVSRVVQLAASLFTKSATTYLFVSTISVYRVEQGRILDETSPVSELDDPLSEEVNGTTYGPLKVLCEHEVRNFFGERSLIVRPGLIVGPNDPTDRFTYWVDRAKRGGPTVVPNRLDQPAQWIDARDLAEFMVRLLEERTYGVYNACGPAIPTTFGDLISALEREFPQMQPVLIDWSTLAKHQVTPWTDLPFVFGEDREGDELFQISNCKAKEAGLDFRPLSNTIRETSEWSEANTSRIRGNFGLTAAKESEILRSLGLATNTDFRE